jgi:peroxiredoxin
MTLAEQLDAALGEAIALDAPLDLRMKVIRDAVRRYSPVFAEAVDRLVDRLQAAEAGANAPKPGERLPSFMLPDSGGQLVSLETLLADGPLVVAFHRGYWCPYCRLHAAALGEVHRQVEGLGTRIVAIAPDRRRFNTQLSAQGGSAVAVLSDIDNAYALSINLAIWVGEEMQALMDAGGFRLPQTQGNDAWMLPIPATFVLDAKGVIVTRDIDPDYRRRMDVDLLLDAVRRLRQAA